MNIDSRLLRREILLSFWKIHILYHAAQGEVVGQWMMDELKEHGYSVSPGTLYPVLQRMEKHGWLKSRVYGSGLRARREYKITKQGRKVLSIVKTLLDELYEEVEHKENHSKRKCG